MTRWVSTDRIVSLDATTTSNDNKSGDNGGDDEANQKIKLMGRSKNKIMRSIVFVF